jgi:energy-coupling factor transport system ATP-binding protein
VTPFAEARGLTVRHIGRRAPALRDLDLRWEEGERLLLLGPSGAGKSTLALCLDGVIPHALDAHWEAGEVRVRGRDTRAAGLAATTSDVGVVFQDPEAQLVTLAIDDEIAFGLENLATPREDMRRRIDSARAEMGLVGARMPERIDQLSGGSKQRLAIASVLAMRSPGIVLDEPTANLDPRGAASVAAAMGTLAADRSRSVLLIEHRIDEILPLVDRVAVIDAAGTLAFEASPDLAFGEHLDDLTSLGAWAPQLALLGRLLGAERPPRTVADAADLVVARVPGRVQGAVAPTQPGPVVLRADHVSHRFRGAAVPALDGATLDVREGEVLAIVGANGAGKTTLALALAGAIRPTGGTVFLAGRDLRTLDPRELRGRVAYVFQYPEHQFIARTARDELLVTLRARGADASSARLRADEALDEAGLAALALADPRSLSHGQKRRLSVATALVGVPQVVILDEPTFGQDRRHTELLAEKMRQLAREGRAAILVTHDMALVADVADRVVALSDGRVAFSGRPEDLFARGEDLAAWGLALPPVAAAFALARQSRADLPFAIGLRSAAAAMDARP